MIGCTCKMIIFCNVDNNYREQWLKPDSEVFNGLGTTGPYSFSQMMRLGRDVGGGGQGSTVEIPGDT